MSVNLFGKLCQKLTKSSSSVSVLYNSVRLMRTRHRLTRFMIMNNYQPWPRPLDIKAVFGNFDENNPAEMRDALRRHGMLPKKVFTDRPLNMNCSGTIFDEFVPNESPDKSSLINISKYSDATSRISSNVKNVRASLKIRKYDPNFDRKTFADIGESIYLETLRILPNYRNNEGRLLELVTEAGLSDMLKGLEKRTLMHTFHKHLEPPSLISVRTHDGLTEGQLFAQVVLRFFSEQTIAIFDKFGRLIYGSHDVPQDVLEYVVFEKYVSEEMSNWRIHAKIVPKSMSNKLVYRGTEKVVQNQSEQSG